MVRFGILTHPTALITAFSFYMEQTIREELSSYFGQALSTDYRYLSSIEHINEIKYGK